MGCKQEKKGESITFEGFRSDDCDHISVKKAKAEEAKAEAIRSTEGR